MEKSIVENGFIIDLSTAQNTSQLVFELSSIMEHPDVSGKNICLKLGSLDLKQSQLLSIKALIESMGAHLAFIDSSSEQTQVSAQSLSINISELNSGISTENYTNKISTDHVVSNIIESHSNEELDNTKTLEMKAESNIPLSPISTTEGIDDIYDEVSTAELSEVIPSESFSDYNFGELAVHEGLMPKEETSKYILRYEGNILIIGDAHPGSEIVAGGDITVWGILGGIAHAGSNGNVTSKVRALKLNAIQLRIAGLYARRNDTLNVPYVQKSNEFTPEEALIEDGKIVIYKKLRRD